MLFPILNRSVSSLMLLLISLKSITQVRRHRCRHLESTKESEALMKACRGRDHHVLAFRMGQVASQAVHLALVALPRQVEREASQEPPVVSIPVSAQVEDCFHIPKVLSAMPFEMVL